MKHIKGLSNKDKWDIVIGMSYWIGEMLQNGMIEEAKSALVTLTAFSADMSFQDLPLSQGNIQHGKEIAIAWMRKYLSPDYNMPLAFKLNDDDTPLH